MNREKCAETMISVMPFIFKKFKKIYQVPNMHRQHLELLFKVGKFEGRPTSFYSEMMMVPKSNVTAASNKLVEEGLIIRIPSKTDRRIIILMPTDKGRDYVEFYKEQVKQSMLERLEVFSDQEVLRLEILVDELKGMINQFNE